jgi:ATP-binding cassette subfamily B protein
VLEDGRIVERGRHVELLVLRGRYAEMWARQQQEADSPAEPGAGDAVAAAATA